MTKSITLYTLEELSNLDKRAFEKAVSQIDIEDYWYCQVTEEWEEFLKEIGFENPEILFGNLYTQGGGACFTSKNVDFEKFINYKKIDSYITRRILTGDTIVDEKFKPLAEHPLLEYMNAKVVHNDTYYHENSCDIESEEFFYKLDLGEEPCQLFSELIKELEKIRYKICLEIYEDLKDNYEVMTSEEYLLEREQEADSKLYFTRTGSLWE